MPLAPSKKDTTLPRTMLEGLCLSLTRAMHEFLQAHAATITVYAEHWEEPDGPRFDVAHRALTQEIEHVTRFVNILRTDLAGILKELPQLGTKQPLSPS